jgi:hypothetical protein
MKRCPQCEFIYEDEQTACDMDGKVLVNAGSFAIIPKNTTANTGVTPKGFRLHSITLPAFAGLMLAAVLSYAYWATPHLASPEKRETKPDSITQPVPTELAPAPLNHAQAEPAESNPSDVVIAETKESFVTTSSESAASQITSPDPKTSNTRLGISRAVPPLPRLRPLPRLPLARVADKNSTSATTTGKPAYVQKAHSNQKPDSKVSSFIKKTGRFLRKPFRL